MNNDKLPPHNTEAEEAVLGSLLIDPDAIATIASWLSPEDFYNDSTRWTYDVCLAMYEKNEAINQITVAESLFRRGKLEEIGGMAYLSHVVSILPTSIHLEHYAQIVHRLASMRRLISAAGQIAAMAYDADSDADSVLSRAEDTLFKLRGNDGSRDFIHIRQILERYFEETDSDDVGVEGHITGIASGFDRLDSLLGGLQRSDMIVLAARPSMGKSSLALRMARNIAVGRKGCVAVFSLEMSKEQIVQRLLSAESGLDTKRLRVSHHNYDEERRIMDASGVLAEARIYIDDTPSPKIAELRSKARRLHYDQGLDLLIIDYLQLIHGSGKSENRVQEISDISRSVKAIARELNIPVIAVSQLSRAVEQRTPHIPLLSDLRESGSIEQDADIVLFIYRADVYFTQEEWERQNPDQEYPEGVATVIVAKHRNGPTGQVDLRFTKNTAKFDNFEPQGVELVTQQALPRISV